MDGTNRNFTQEAQRAYRYLSDPEKKRLFPDDEMWMTLLTAVGMWGETLTTSGTNVRIAPERTDG